MARGRGEPAGWRHVRHHSSMAPGDACARADARRPPDPRSQPRAGQPAARLRGSACADQRGRAAIGEGARARQRAGPVLRVSVVPSGRARRVRPAEELRRVGVHQRLRRSRWGTAARPAGRPQPERPPMDPGPRAVPRGRVAPRAGDVASLSTPGVLDPADLSALSDDRPAAVAGNVDRSRRVVRAVCGARPCSRPLAPRRRAEHGLVRRRPRGQQVVRLGPVGARHAVRSRARGRLRRQRPHVPGGRLRAVRDRAIPAARGTRRCRPSTTAC